MGTELGTVVAMICALFIFLTLPFARNSFYSLAGVLRKALGWESNLKFRLCNTQDQNCDLRDFINFYKQVKDLSFGNSFVILMPLLA